MRIYSMFKEESAITRRVPIPLALGAVLGTHMPPWFLEPGREPCQPSPMITHRPPPRGWDCQGEVPPEREPDAGDSVGTSHPCSSEVFSTEALSAPKTNQSKERVCLTSPEGLFSWHSCRPKLWGPSAQRTCILARETFWSQSSLDPDVGLISS